jgi:ABC-type uncharacterized transport system substrate-binding protein
MRRVVILSSYGFMRQKREVVTVRGFIRALEEDGWREGIDFELEIHHASRLATHEDFLRKRLAGPVDLIYAGGASLMEVARRVLRECDATKLPLIYWGSHIVDRNRCINPLPEDENIRGVILNMPLFYNHRQFRLLRALFPQLESIYCAFSTQSAFCVSTVKENYEAALAELGADCWIDSRSRFGGFPGLGRLAAVVGLTFYEHPCTDAATMRSAVENISRSRSSPFRDSTAVLLTCLDCFHIPGAVEAIREATGEWGFPWIGLNSGPCHCADGPLAVFENDLEHASYQAGKLALGRLRGTPPEKVKNVMGDRFVFRFNGEKAKKQGFELPPSALHQIQKQFAIAPLESSETCLTPP